MMVADNMGGHSSSSNYETAIVIWDFSSFLGWRIYLRFYRNLCFRGCGSQTGFDVPRLRGMPGDGGRARGQFHDGLE